MKIITVTLNPSLDRTMQVHYLSVGYVNRTTEATRLDAAGRGMNIAEALHRLGGTVEAVVLLGNDPVSAAYEELLKDEAFPIHLVRFEGGIRSNIIIKDTATGTETFIREDGSPVSKAVLHRVAETLVNLLEPDDYLVLAGSLPQDSPEDDYLEMLQHAKKAGVKLVIRNEGEALKQALASDPYLVALHQIHVESFFNMPIRVLEDVVQCGNELLKMGAHSALIMLRDDSGAVLVSPEETLMVEFPDDLPTGTHSGSFSALLAGYLIGRSKKRSLGSALELGAAASVYTITQVGSAFGTLQEVKEHLTDVQIQPIEEESTD